MTLPSTEYAWYVQRRSRLYERLDATRRQVDEWLATHVDEGATLRDIVQVGGLLATRGDQLTEMEHLDNEFLDFLLKFGREH